MYHVCLYLCLLFIFAYLSYMAKRRHAYVCMHNRTFILLLGHVYEVGIVIITVQGGI